jgi:hypothetical protein
MQVTVRTPTAWIWVAAGVAFSPALFELARQTVEFPQKTTPLVAALLLLVSARRESAREVPGRGGAILLLAAAAALELLGVLGGAATLARASVPLALVGIARLLGRPPLRIALISLWLVPIPVSLVALVPMPLDQAAARFVASVAELLGVAASSVGPLVRVGEQSFELSAAMAAVHLAWLLALLGWYAAALRGEELARAAATALASALLVLLLQPLLLVMAALALVWLGPPAAGALLDPVFPLVVALGGMLLAERGRAQARAAILGEDRGVV